MSGHTWWCDACNTTHAIGKGWCALWLTASGGCGVLRNVTPGSIDTLAREVVYACGEGSALVLFERYLHTGSFVAPHDAPALPAYKITGNTAVENF